MLYLAKGLQAAGLAWVAINYLLTLPATPRGEFLAVGAAIFIAGWLVQRLSK